MSKQHAFRPPFPFGSEVEEKLPDQILPECGGVALIPICHQPDLTAIAFPGAGRIIPKGRQLCKLLHAGVNVVVLKRIFVAPPEVWTAYPGGICVVFDLLITAASLSMTRGVAGDVVVYHRPLHWHPPLLLPIFSDENQIQHI